MRRFCSALFLLVLSACAHESTRPAASAERPANRARAGSQSGLDYPRPGSRPAADDQTLAREYGGAPALATLEGEASYYGDSLAGHATASGEPYRPLAFTAAHRKLPLGTVLRVTRKDGSRAVYVRVNDRGPYGGKRRILDLSRAAAAELGMLRAGVLEVRAEVVEYGRGRGH